MSTNRRKLMDFKSDDGGRSITRSGQRRGDCVTRSIAIASGLPYEEVYQTLAEGNASQRITKRTRKSSNTGKKSADYGINVNRKWFKDQMQAWGFTWVPCMGIGTGCKVHLVKGELPMGRLVVALSKHYTSVIDGVIHDTGNPQRVTIIHKRDGTKHLAYRCVYGYWVYNQPASTKNVFATGKVYKPEKHIEHLFQNSQYSLKRCLRKPAEWFSSEIENLAKVYGNEISSPSSIMEARQGSGDKGLASSILPGNLYMCGYNPSHKHGLPYHDKFPLIMPYKTESRTFRALNFHYLPYQARILLIGHLMRYADTKSFWTGKIVLNDKTRIRFDREAIEKSSLHLLAESVSHEYRHAHVNTQFKRIEPRHWVLMMLLPTESFVAATKTEVWNDVIISTTKKHKNIYKERSMRKRAICSRNKLLSLSSKDKIASKQG